jgi:hypothetical protein
VVVIILKCGLENSSSGNTVPGHHEEDTAELYKIKISE